VIEPQPPRLGLFPERNLKPFVRANPRGRSGYMSMTLPKHASRASRDDDQVLSFAEWCALNKISRRTGNRILAGPDGPVVTQLSARRVGITRRNNAEWQRSRERRT
jgi:hypothetical protein